MSVPSGIVVSALSGTVGERVLIMLKAIGLKAEFKIGVREGYFLEDGIGRSFSPKNHTPQEEVYTIRVGRNMTPARFTNVAQNLAAILRRGREWTDVAGIVRDAPYGTQAIVRPKRNDWRDSRVNRPYFRLMRSERWGHSVG